MARRKECFCNEQFDVKACSVQGIYKTADVMAHDPESVACPHVINVISELLTHTPISPAPSDRVQWRR